jgi:hypothetical protein
MSETVTMTMTAEGSCAEQHRARHHFPQEINEWDRTVLKFRTNLYSVGSVVSGLKDRKLRYSKVDV